MDLRKSPRLTELLAASYVVGTLQGRARRRFMQMLRTRPWLSRLVRDWEDRLLPAVLGDRPRAAPHWVWQSIAAQLPLASPAASRHLRWWQTPLWPALSGALAVALLLVWLWPTPSRMFLTGVLTNPAGKPTWVIRANRHHMRLSTLEPVSVPAGHAYQLWAIVPGRQPISMGLLPTQPGQSPVLSAPQRIDMKSVQMVAVTMEPAGGSPTGQPTGPILFKAYLVDS